VHPEEPVFRSLAGEIIVALGGKAPEGDKDIRFAVKYPPNADVAGTSELREKSGTYAYAPRSIQSIFVPKSWRLNYADGGYFRDKVVMIGPTSPLFQDIHQTPVGQLTGPQLHLQAAASGLAGAFDERVGLGSARYNAVTAALGMLVAALWAWWVKRPMISAGGAVAFVAVVMAGVIAFGIYAPWILGITAGVGAFGVGWLAALSYDLVTERLERGRLNREFRRFVSRDVADMLVREPEMYQAAAAGRRRRVVVLFSDVRGFTSRSEKADPAELVGQLNEYLTKMVDVVFRHEGTLDKFIGDAVMAHWGALEDGSDATHATRAVEAAKAMIGELDRLNEGWKSEDRDPFKIGIGLHIGEVVSGEIGCAERTEFGVIGDAVNLASRIEGLTKHYSAPLLISGAVAELIDHESGLRCVGRLRVKGRREPVVLFTPGLGPENDGRFAEALRTFEAGDFARAAEAFAGLVLAHPDDGPAAYLMRCAEIYVAAPPEGWDGVIVMESK
jgi:adenylate cyclase